MGNHVSLIGSYRPAAFEFHGKRFVHADEVMKRGGPVRMRQKEGDFQTFKSARDLSPEALEHAKALTAAAEADNA